MIEYVDDNGVIVSSADVESPHDECFEGITTVISEELGDDL